MKTLIQSETRSLYYAQKMLFVFCLLQLFILILFLLLQVSSRDTSILNLILKFEINYDIFQ